MIGHTVERFMSNDVEIVHHFQPRRLAFVSNSFPIQLSYYAVVLCLIMIVNWLFVSDGNWVFGRGRSSAALRIWLLFTWCQSVGCLTGNDRYRAANPIWIQVAMNYIDKLIEFQRFMLKIDVNKGLYQFLIEFWMNYIEKLMEFLLFMLKNYWNYVLSIFLIHFRMNYIEILIDFLLFMLQNCRNYLFNSILNELHWEIDRIFTFYA